jgi:hypothetical protein
VFGDLKKSGAWVRERPVPERPPTYCVFGIYYFVISDLSDLDDFEESGQPTRLGSLELDSRQRVPCSVGPHGEADCRQAAEPQPEPDLSSWTRHRSWWLLAAAGSSRSTCALFVESDRPLKRKK